MTVDVFICVGWYKSVCAIIAKGFESDKNHAKYISFKAWFNGQLANSWDQTSVPNKTQLHLVGKISNCHPHLSSILIAARWRDRPAPLFLLSWSRSRISSERAGSNFCRRVKTSAWTKWKTVGHSKAAIHVTIKNTVTILLLLTTTTETIQNHPKPQSSSSSSSFHDSGTCGLNYLWPASIPSIQYQHSKQP